MIASKVSITFLVFIFISIAFVDVVSAQSTNISNELEVYIEADDRFDYDRLINLADPNDEQYSNYNLTWIPFFENNTDIRGITTIPVLTPWMVEINQTLTSYNYFSTGSFFKFDSNTLIDGGSESWWRLPIHNISYNATINMRIYKSYAATFNVTIDGQSLIFKYPDSVDLIYNMTMDENYVTDHYYHDYVRRLNLTIDTNTTMNFTYFKATCPILPNTFYFVFFNIYQNFADNATFFLSPCDFGNDEIYNSWMELNDEDYYFSFDLDTSVIFTIGLSNGISGMGFNETKGSYEGWFEYYLNIDDTISSSDYNYLNYLIPVLNPSNESVTVRVLCKGYSNEAENLVFLLSEQQKIINQTQDFLIGYWNVSSYPSEYIHHIRLFIKLYAANASDLRFWLNADTQGFVEQYYRHLTEGKYRVGKHHFCLFGYISIDDGYWENTELSITVIPIEQPLGELEIVKEYQRYKAYIYQKKMGRYLKTVFFYFWFLPLWKATGRTFIDLLIEGEVILSLFNVYSDFINSPRIKDILNFIFKIGTYVKYFIEWAIPFFEWLCYWGVRLIYSFGVGMVYMINTFAMITICSAFYQFARTKKGIALVNEFEKGWKFIWTILSLLISFAILIVGIISAVMPG